MERCFKLAVSIDLETAAHAHKAVAGVTTGLIGPGETVTWQDRLFGRTFRHQSIIEIWQPFSHFRDVMVSGFFKATSMTITSPPRTMAHAFATRSGSSPRWANWVSCGALLRRRINRLLRRRNSLIKQAAESDAWHHFLDGQPALDQRVYQALSASASEGESRAFAK